MPNVEEAERTKESSPARGPVGERDERLLPLLMDRFSVLAEQCARFSQEIYYRTGTSQQTPETLKRNLEISRTVFTQWSIDVLAVVYLHGTVGFEDLRRALGISTAALAKKLADLEGYGLVQRTLTGAPPRKARYALTHKGTVISRLGEPVFLYLRLASGWSEAASPAARGRAATAEAGATASPESGHESAEASEAGQTLIVRPFLSAFRWLRLGDARNRRRRARKSASESPT